MKVTSYLSDDFFSRLETLSLDLQADLTGFFGGKHLIKQYGQSVEFADFREYELGDDIRRIDWNLYARLHKYFLKLFTDERQMHVQIFLDCSASMGLYPEKSAYAVAIAAAIGFLAVHNTDKVTFRMMKDRTAEDPFGHLVGKNAFFSAIGELEKLSFEGDVDFAAAIPDLPDSGESDGLTVVISDFFTESDWKKAVDFLLHKKRQVLLMQILAKEDVDPLYAGRLNLIDAESSYKEDPRNLKMKITRSLINDYAEELNALINEIGAYAASRNVTFISVNTDTAIETTIFRDLLQSDIIK